MLKAILIKLLPKFMEKSFIGVMDRDIMKNNIMPKCAKIKPLQGKRPWRTFVKFFAKTLRDWADEVDSCANWHDNN